MAEQRWTVTGLLCLSRRQCFAIALAVVLVELVVMLLSQIRLHMRPANDPLIQQLYGYDDETADSFLQLYRSYCDSVLYPKMSNVPTRFMPDYNDSLCSCVPDVLGLFTRLDSMV